MEYIGEVVRVYNAVEKEWISGIIDEYYPRKGYHVHFYDGDDQWIANVDLEFERHISPEVYESPFKKSSTNFINENDDLNMVQPHFSDEEQESEEIQPARDNQNDENDNTKSIHRQIITEELQHLAERGILLVGSVLEVNNLPSSEDNNSKLLFKVLFVEGGSKHTMFKCKTPIFTSGFTENTDTVKWNENLFKFEMEKNEVESNNVNNDSDLINGEILIAIYKSRINGGNELMGELSLELQDIIQYGTIEFHHVDYEGRLFHGMHPLLNRSGQPSGEIKFEISLIWKKSRKYPAIDSSPLKSAYGRGFNQREDSFNILNKPSSNQKISANNSVSHTQDGEKSALNQKSVKQKKAIVTKKDPHSYTVTSEPRKIVSKQLRKQREDARKYEKANKLLEDRIGFNKNKSVEKESMEPRKAVRTTGPDTNHVDTDKKEELFKIFMDLKRSNAEAEKENKGLRGRLSALQVGIFHAKKHLQNILANEKKKVGNEQSSMMMNQDEDVEMEGNGKDLTLKSQIGRDLLINKAKTETAAEDTEREGGGKNESRANRVKRDDHLDDDQNGNDNEYDEDGYPKPDDDEDVEDGVEPLPTGQGITKPSDDLEGAATSPPPTGVRVTDAELDNLTHEYDVLQKVRRSLMDRIHRARSEMSKAQDTVETMGNKTDQLVKRLKYFQKLMNEGPSANELNPIDLKDIFQDVLIQLDFDSWGDDPLDQSDEDFLLFQQIQLITFDIDRLKTIRAEELHVMAMANEMDVLQIIRTKLSDHFNELNGKVEELRKKKEILRSNMKKLLESDVMFRMREFVTKMHTIACRNERHERMKVIEEGCHAIELEILRMKLLQRQKKEKLEKNIV